MAKGLKTVTYPVTDIAAAKARFSELLGVEPYIDEPYYVAFNVDGHDVGLDPNGHRDAKGPVPYWHVDDIETSLKALVDGGAQTVQEPKDVGGGSRIARVRDSDGNVVGLFQEG